MSKGKKIGLIAAAVVVVLAAVIGGMLIVANGNQERVYAADIRDVDLALVSDGTYIGEYNAFPVSAKVEVTVKDHQIAGIDLIKHQNGQGGDADVIPQMVVDAQSIEVDTVSGATFSSKVILLAIQNALLTAAGE